MGSSLTVHPLKMNIAEIHTVQKTANVFFTTITVPFYHLHLQIVGVKKFYFHTASLL